MALAPINPTQITPPRVNLIDERSGAISREWYRFFLSLLTATQTNQQETELSPDTSALLASYDAMLADLAQTTENAPDSNSFSASLESQLYSLDNEVSIAPPSMFGTVTSVAASGGTTGLTFTGSPITTSGTLTLGGTLAVANGGTNQTTYTDGQLLIGNTTGNTLTKATLTAGTNISITNGAGAITINAADQFVGTVTSVSGTGTVNGITLTGTVTTSGSLTLGGTLSGVSLTTQVAGILPIANGGTNGTATPTAGGVAYGTGTAYAVNAAGPAGYVLTSGGTAPPVWTPVASLAVGTEAYWGSFWDTTTQTAAAINTAYALTLNTADVENNGVTIVSGSRVTFIHAGVYSLTFSAQLTNTDNSNTAHIANIWIRKNGADVTATDSKFTVPGKFGSTQGAIIGTVNFVLPIAASDYIELVWSTTDTSVTVTSFPAGTTPVTPVVPSIIFTAVAAAPVGLGYAGVESLTSLTVGTGSKTFTVNTNATDTAFIVGNRVRLVNSSVNYMDGVITAYSGTSMTVLVDGTAGSGTYTAWFVTLTGSVGGVTSFSGNSTGLTPSTPTAGAIALAGTLNVANGGTGQTTYTDGQLLIGNTTGNTLAKATLTAGTNVSITNGAGAITINATDQFVGTVTSVGGTGAVNGITLTGTVTSSGNLTLGGTLSGVSLTTQVSGTLPVANGGTNAGAFTAGSIVFAGTSGTYTQNNANLFWDNTNSRLGIGTTAPGTKLEVSSTSNAATAEVLRLSNPGSGANTAAQIKFLAAGTNYGTITGGYGAVAPQTTFDLPVAGNYVWQQASVEKMRLNNDGDLLVGIATSTYNAAGRGVIDINGSGQAILGLSTGGTAAGYIYHDGTSMYVWQQRNSFMAFATNGLERLRLTAAGNMGLGTTTPAYQLELSTDSAAKPTSALWTIASDSRIKTETGEYTKGLDAVCALRPITYQYNGAAGFTADGKENISIVAQEAMQHFPECVGTFEALLNEGDEEKTELYNWNGHALTFALVNAVKELKTANDALAARVAQLEGK
jgi:hypothetical protein